ncbi:MAG: Tn3 family transposase [Chloroflexota bacterium]|nr:Tn3 family transposase [Chloroflexota bacterium]
MLPLALTTDNPLALLTQLVDACRAHQILLPAILTLERLAWGVRTRAARQLYQTLTAQLTATQRQRLAALLKVPTAGRTIPLTWLRQPPGESTPAHFLQVVKRLEFIRALDLPPLTTQIHPNRRLQLAREGARYTPQHLRQLIAPHQQAVLVAFLLHASTELTDQALAMHDRIMGKLLNRSEYKQSSEFQRNGKAINEKVRLYAQVGKAVIAVKETDKPDVFAAITSVLTWERFVSTVEEADKLARPTDFDYLDLLITRYPYLRQYAPTLLARFTFQAAPAQQVLLSALETLRDLNATGKKKLPLTAPTAFIPPRWEKLVLTAQGLDRRYYEMCALAELRNALRAGDVWVAGSRHFQDFETYLLTPAAWQERRTATPPPLAVPLDFGRYLEQRTEVLQPQLRQVNEALSTGALAGVRMDKGVLHITPLTNSEPPGLDAAARRVYDQIPRTKITDLLAEVAGWTGFDRHFTHLQTGLPSGDREALLTAILAEGINLGPAKMAEACSGMTYHRLAWTADWYLREETYRKALAEVINLQHRQPFAAHWGSGTTSSSDGQTFPVGGPREARAAVNPRHGPEPRITFYGHLSDQYSPFYMQPISVQVREAPYAIDGLLYHETDLQIHEHYVDTHGFTDQVFGAATLLNFRYAPRIRNLGDHRLYILGEAADYPALAPLMGGQLNVRRLAEQWDNVLRLICSIREGTVPASLILSKLAAYPRQNSMAWALREVGRLERTLWVLDWLQDPALRRRVTVGLNKGEARHSMSKAVFCHRHGELWEQEFTEQWHRASGLNLVVAAIVLWNTVYLEDAVQRLREQGRAPSAELLAHISPLSWEHINLTGDYRWDLRLISALESRRPLRDRPQ